MTLPRLLLVPYLGALFGCGPSFQAVYNGEAKFERCYATDERADRTLAEKRECWKEWLDRYTYAQTLDRVEYANSRYNALSQIPAMPTDDALMQGAPGGGERTPAALPAPTSAFANPVTMLSEECKKCSNELAQCKTECRQDPCVTCRDKELQCQKKCSK